jgi:hypothetical protein
MRGPNLAAAEAVFVEAITAINTAQKLISTRIREIYKGSVTSP